MSKKVEIYTAGRPEEVVLIVNGTRVCGPEDWDGGPIHHEFEVGKKELYAALWPVLTKEQLWSRLTRLAGRAMFSRGSHGCPFLVEDATSVQAIRYLIDQLKDDIFSETARKSKKIAAKLEAALKAWEVAP